MHNPTLIQFRVAGGYPTCYRVRGGYTWTGRFLSQGQHRHLLTPMVTLVKHMNKEAVMNLHAQ